MGNEIARKNLTDNKTPTKSPIVQRKSVNSTRLPDTLQRGTESMSGLSLNDVHLHYNSSKPAQLKAHAYTQGGVAPIVQMASKYYGIMPHHKIALNKLENKMKDDKDKTFGWMDLTYHHIIPENILVEVFTQSLQPAYKYCLEHSKVVGADELIQVVEKLIKSGSEFRDQTDETDKRKLKKTFGNNDFTYSKEFDKNSDMEAKSKVAVNGDFGAAVRWIPGNIHQGPKNRTERVSNVEINNAATLAELYTDGGDFKEDFIQKNKSLMTDDGGSGFEYAAVNAVGKDRIKKLAQLLADMFKLPKFDNISKDNVDKNGENQEIKNAIIGVKNIIATIDSLFYDQEGQEQQNGKKPFHVPEMDLDKWEKTEDVDANKAKWKLKSK